MFGWFKRSPEDEARAEKKRQERRDRKAVKEHRKALATIFGNDHVWEAEREKIDPKFLKYNKVAYAARGTLGNIFAGSGLAGALGVLTLIGMGFMHIPVAAFIGAALAAKVMTGGFLLSAAVGSLAAFGASHFIERGPEKKNMQNLHRFMAEAKQKVEAARQDIIDRVNAKPEEFHRYLGKLVMFREEDVAKLQDPVVRMKVKEASLRISGKCPDDVVAQLQEAYASGDAAKLSMAEHALDRSYRGYTPVVDDSYYWPQVYFINTGGYGYGGGGSWGGGGGGSGFADLFKDFGGGKSDKDSGQAILVLLAIAVAVTAVVGNAYRLLKSAAPVITGIDAEAMLPDATEELKKRTDTLIMMQPVKKGSFLSKPQGLQGGPKSGVRLSLDGIDKKPQAANQSAHQAAVPTIMVKKAAHGASEKPQP